MTVRPLAILVALSLVLPTAARADALDEYARARMESLHLPGLAIAVLRNGEVSAMRTWGMADVEKKTRVAPDTVFELGSLSKQFTAVAVMMLAEEGKLRIDDRVARHLPEAPKAWATISLRHLLTHSSGIRDYLADPALAERVHAAANHDEIARVLAEGSTLEFAPDDTWAYSNSGYLLLGCIVERASGMSYGSFLEQKIFAPLGMRDSGLIGTSTQKRGAAGYGFAEGKFVRREPVPANAFSAGGVVSTIADMARWEAALHSGTLLTEASWKTIWTPLALNHGRGTPPFSYGFGWVIDRHHGEPVVLHGGGTPGFSSAIRRHLGSGTTVIVLANRGDRIIDHLAMEAGARVFPVMGRTRMADPDPVRSVALMRGMSSLLSGEVEGGLFTPPAQQFLKRTANGRGMAEWIASHGTLTSLAFAEGERDGQLRILRYRAKLSGEDYWLTLTLTRTGEIAQIYWW